MGGQPCPNCKKGFLLLTSQGTKRCKQCGFTRYNSFNKKGMTVEGLIKEEKKTEGENIPEIPAKKENPRRRPRGAIPRGEGYHTNEYKDNKFMHDMQIKLRNKHLAVQKELARLKKANKYSGMKQVIIEGELWDIESGKLVREKEKPEKSAEEEFTPDRIIEDMVEEQSG